MIRTLSSAPHLLFITIFAFTFITIKLASADEISGFNHGIIVYNCVFNTIIQNNSHRHGTRYLNFSVYLY